MKFITMLVVVAFLCCGCLSKYDPLSEQHADQSISGLQHDLNNGLTPLEVDFVIATAFDLAVPAAPPADPAADDARKQLFERFGAILSDLVMFDISIEIAIERAESWLRYEQSKRSPRPQDLPRFDPVPDDE